MPAGDRTTSLSVCCLVRDPPRRAAAVLETLRPVADEIVVAVDAAAPYELGSLGAVADRLYRVPVRLPFEQYLPWLHSLCGSEWVFRIDGDEVPSAALVAVLAALRGAEDVLQYRLPRRWLFGGAGTWLAQEPWAPDHQIRIVRNDPRTLRFRGTLHSTAEPILPARFLAEPIYHLALLLSTREERETRVERYATLPSAGNVDNATYYLPEHLQTPSLAQAPPEDLALIERALARNGEVENAGKAAVAAIEVPLAEAMRLSPLRELPPEAYSVEIEPLVEAIEMPVDGVREVPVRLRNQGGERFPWGDWSPAVRLSYHWLDHEGRAVIFDGERTMLPADLAPWREEVVLVRIGAPPAPGRYLLEIDLVHEHVRWFGCGARVIADIEPGAHRTRWRLR